jgi:UDP-N-acetylmuramyl pentapeptide phosphotransferase/UDP-N-acetylglucosamine-1-phosphate transferase
MWLFWVENLLGVGLLAYLGVAVLRWWAVRSQMLDIPNERSSHTRPTPRGGGLVIVVVTLGGLILAWLIRSTIPAGMLLAYVAGASMIATVSWIDDRRPLSNRIRFAVHSCGAILAIAAIGYWEDVALPGVGTLNFGWWGLPITLLWIVGLTNGYNFMDGIDGIAGSQATIAALGWAWLGHLAGQPAIEILGLLIAATSLGFLVHNWPPAKIFMGDVSSSFLGYSFAVLPLLLAATSNSRVQPADAPLAGILFVWLFAFDTTFTFFRRLLNREDVFKAHRSHLYQRLVISGWSHRAVTLLYIALALMGSVTAAGWALQLPWATAAVLGLPLAAAALVVFVYWQEQSANQRKASLAGATKEA